MAPAFADVVEPGQAPFGVQSRLAVAGHPCQERSTTTIIAMAMTNGPPTINPVPVADAPYPR